MCSVLDGPFPHIPMTENILQRYHKSRLDFSSRLLLIVFLSSFAVRSVRHFTLNVQTGHFGLAICLYRNGLLEIAGHATCSVISNLDFAFLSRSNRGLGVLRNRAAATCHCLIDNQRLLANVCESEYTFLLGVLTGEFAEAVCDFFEFGFCRLLC